MTLYDRMDCPFDIDVRLSAEALDIELQRIDIRPDPRRARCWWSGGGAQRWASLAFPLTTARPRWTSRAISSTTLRGPAAA